MSQDPQFKQLERKAYLSYHQDGLIDIIIGMCILGFGINIATGTSAFGILGWMPILFYVPLKNRVTVPRLGYVRFTQKRTKAVLLTLAIVVAMVALLLALGIYVFAISDSIPPAIQAFLKEYNMLIFGLIGSLLFLGGALLSGIRRFFAYAGLTVTIILAGIWLGMQPPVYVLILGVSILAVGIWMLVRFLRRYPLTTGEQSDAIG